ncbi:hypothetical protein WAK64_04345 [Bacillus spongiae]|uniref:Uncharacterized protein n=1 Tax=Bacillus spongiae TaxID=2683610 RepID=A0ABU8HAS1_9BACI
MFGSVDYFINSFKACIMINYQLEKPCSISTKYSLLKAEIMERAGNHEEQLIYLRNVERAYKIINRELFEWEEEKDGS